MHRVYTPGGSFVTGDRIAHALLRYAAVLGSRGMSAQVTITVLDDEGETQQHTIALGPMSLGMTVKAINTDPSLNDEAELNELERQRRAVVASTDGQQTSDFTQSRGA